MTEGRQSGCERGASAPVGGTEAGELDPTGLPPLSPGPRARLNLEQLFVRTWHNEGLLRAGPGRNTSEASSDWLRSFLGVNEACLQPYKGSIVSPCFRDKEVVLYTSQGWALQSQATM